jgi:hypothetical protein
MPMSWLCWNHSLSLSAPLPERKIAFCVSEMVKSFLQMLATKEGAKTECLALGLRETKQMKNRIIETRTERHGVLSRSSRWSVGLLRQISWSVLFSRLFQACIHAMGRFCRASGCSSHNLQYRFMPFN